MSFRILDAGGSAVRRVVAVHASQPPMAAKAMAMASHRMMDDFMGDPFRKRSLLKK